MKKSFLLITIFGIIFSCSKSDIQQTTNTIKSADSLLNSAKDGFKTLDSISKIVNDSAKINKIIVPEIQKTKETVENAIKDNAKSLDSINSVIKKTTDNISKSADVLKTVDSAREALKNSKNPIDALSTISKTLDKVSKKTKTQTSPENQVDKPVESSKQTEISKQTPVPSAVPAPASPQENLQTNPLVKNMKIEVTVDNLSKSRDELATILRRYGAEMVTENFGEQNGFRKQTITAKIPFQYFEEASRALSQDLGTLKTKNIETQGRDYSPNQMCEVEITLSENRQYAGSESISTDNAKKIDPENEKTFIEKFGVLGIVILVCLILIPLMLLVIYLMNRQMKKKMEKQIQAQSQQRQNSQNAENQIKTSSSESNNHNDEDPYEKYKPKF